MKNKTKIMLGLSALTAGTLAAGATGTFAWFTTNKVATATYSNIVAAATTGNLTASIAKVTDQSVTIDNDTDKYNVTATASGTSKTADVSSNDGISFGQPNWKSTSGNSETTLIDGVTDVTEKDYYFTQYLVTLTNTTSTDGQDTTVAAVKVNLTGVSFTTDSGTELASWTRVAIITDPVHSDAKHRITSGGSSTLYQKTVTDATKKYARVGATYTTMGGTGDTAAITTVTNSVYATSDTLGADTGKLSVSASLASGASVTVGVAVWLEGTMADNQDAAKGQKVGVKLSFQTEPIE